MKILTKKTLILGMLAMLSFQFESCTKQLSYSTHSSRMMVAQSGKTMQTPAPAPEKTAAVTPAPNTCTDETAANTQMADNSVKDMPAAADNQVKKNMPAAKAKLALAHAEKFIAKNKSMLAPVLAHPKTTAVHGAKHTQGWLGAAVLFLILGIVFAFLGFSSLGALFWAIGVVLLVVGIIFFILWLAAAAV